MTFWGFSTAFWCVLAFSFLTYILRDAITNLVAWVTNGTARIAGWLAVKK